MWGLVRIGLKLKKRRLAEVISHEEVRVKRREKLRTLRVEIGRGIRVRVRHVPSRNPYPCGEYSNARNGVEQQRRSAR
jgi:hypothetical protein